MKRSIEVIPPGTKTTIDGVPVMVLQVCIGSADDVTYQCAWWDGRKRTTEWLQACEIASDSERRTIGFKGA